MAELKLERLTANNSAPPEIDDAKEIEMALALVCLAHLPTTRSAIAITAELARKCGALTDKAYPLRVPGNPAAGREHGTAKEVRDYFNKCVANGGNIDKQHVEPGNRTQTPKEGSDKEGQAPKKGGPSQTACFEPRLRSLELCARGSAGHLKLDRTAGQPKRVIVMCERTPFAPGTSNSVPPFFRNKVQSARRFRNR